MRLTGLAQCLIYLISVLIVSFFWKFIIFGTVVVSVDEDTETAMKTVVGHMGTYVVGMETAEGEFKTLGITIVGKSTVESGKLGYVAAMIAKISFKLIAYVESIKTRKGKVQIYIKESIVDLITLVGKSLITVASMDIEGFWLFGSIILIGYALTKALLNYYDEIIETEADREEMNKKNMKQEKNNEIKIEKRRKRKEAFQQFKKSIYKKFKWWD